VRGTAKRSLGGGAVERRYTLEEVTHCIGQALKQLPQTAETLKSARTTSILIDRIVDQLKKAPE